MIQLSDREKQIIGGYMSAIRNAEAARAQMMALCSVIIERAGGDASKPWQLSQDGSALEEVSDGVAE